VLNKTSASAGLVIVTAAGALLASSPAYAVDGLVRGSWIHSHHRSHHRNRNWNGNRHHSRIFIRIYIYNKNNNHAIAIARPEHRRRRGVVLREAVPADGVIGTPGVDATPVEPARGGSREAAPAAPAAETNLAPANTTPDQSTAGAPAAPLDEAATGNVNP